MSAVALALFLAVVPTPEEPPPEFVPHLHVTGEERVQLIRTWLDIERRDTTAWWLGWAAFWTASTAGQFAMYPLTAKEELPSLYVWGIASGVGTIVSWLLKPDGTSLLRKLDARLADPSLSQEQRVLEAERAFLKARDEEIDSHIWWQQIPIVAMNVIPFVVLAAAYKRYDVPFLILGLVISEAQCFTFPQLLRRFGVDRRVVAAF